MNTIESGSLNHVQERHFVGLDLSPNCLQRLSVVETDRQRVKPTILGIIMGV